MRIIKDRRIVEDSWTHAGADALEGALPDGDIIVPLAVWKARRVELETRNTKIGVQLEPGNLAPEIAEDLEKFSLVALNFPTFRDGRAFSTAQLLRQRYGFTGEIRAVGQVGRDQMFYMQRCGFNAFEVRADRDIADALNALGEFTETYQTAADQPLPLYRRR